MTINRKSNIKFSALLLTLIFSLTLGGCFQNDGYIGDFFGSWVVESIEIDGEPDPDYDYDTVPLTFYFQSALFSMIEVRGAGQIMGIWEEKGSELILQGAVETTSLKDSEGNPIFPPSSHFGSGTDNDMIVILEIVTKSKKKMVWQRTDSEGRTWTYTLRHLL